VNDINIDFIDEYSACSRTYATLCLYHPEESPIIPTSILDISPDRTIEEGAPKNGWFLSTQNRIQSRDIRRHIVSLLTKTPDFGNKLNEIRLRKWDAHLDCFWESASGNGGPILDHKFISFVSSYNLDLTFDIWFGD